jgi:hypothetical protein
MSGAPQNKPLVIAKKSHLVSLPDGKEKHGFILRLCSKLTRPQEPCRNKTVTNVQRKAKADGEQIRARANSEKSLLSTLLFDADFPSGKNNHGQPGAPTLGPNLSSDAINARSARATKSGTLAGRSSFASFS